LGETGGRQREQHGNRQEKDFEYTSTSSILHSANPPEIADRVVLFGAQLERKMNADERALVNAADAYAVLRSLTGYEVCGRISIIQRTKKADKESMDFSEILPRTENPVRPDPKAGKCIAMRRNPPAVELAGASALVSTEPVTLCILPRKGAKTQTAARMRRIPFCAARSVSARL
jgi:hypothetical protein